VLTCGLWLLVWLAACVRIGGWQCTECGGKQVQHSEGPSRAFVVAVVVVCAFWGVVWLLTG